MVIPKYLLQVTIYFQFQEIATLKCIIASSCSYSPPSPRGTGRIMKSRYIVPQSPTPSPSIFRHLLKFVSLPTVLILYSCSIGNMTVYSVPISPKPNGTYLNFASNYSLFSVGFLVLFYVYHIS